MQETTLNNAKMSHPRPVYIPSTHKKDNKYTSEELREKMQMVRTVNGNGFHFLRRSETIDIWLASLPNSESPLLDIGCAFGGNTLRALRAGRNAIALDASTVHVKEAQRNAQALCEEMGTTAVGALVREVVARLPSPDCLCAESVSGALCLDVLHFLQPGEALPLFRDAFKWLEPGGKFVLSSGSPVGYEKSADAGMTIHHGRSYEGMWAFIESASDLDLVQDCPAFVSTEGMPGVCEIVGPTLYNVSTQELEALCRLSGFDILDLRYYSPNRYPVRYSAVDDCVLLVASKPL